MSAIADHSSFKKLTASALEYRADIDGLRAVAVILVLVFHFALVPGNTAGFMGVDMFFVISGFLITSILKRQLDTRTFDLRKFYINRVRRLAPSLTAVLIIVSGLGAVLLFPDEYIELLKQVLVSQFYVANIYFWRNVNYFGLGVHDVYLLHMWSLAVEEQFYVFYPMCLLLLHRYTGRYFWRAIALGCVASFILSIFFVYRKPEATFYLFPTRAWEFLIGALVPEIANRWSRSRYIDEAIGVSGIAAIAVGVTFYRSDISFPGFYALLPTLGTASVLLSGLGRTTVVSNALGWQPVVYLGKISYSMYLVHWPINVFAERLIRNYSLNWRLAMFALSIAAAAALFHLLEDPLRRRKYLADNSRMLHFYVSGLALAASMFAVVQFTGGLPQRFPSDVVRLASRVNDKTAPLKECEFNHQALADVASFCRIGAERQTPTWLIYGDSHAWAGHEVFDKWLKQNGQTGLFIFMHSCPPLLGVHLFGDKDACFDFNQAIAGFLEGHPQVSNVVLVSVWRQGAEGRLSIASDTLSTREQSERLFADGLSRTLEHLHALAKHVYIWEPVPGARRNVPIEMAQAALRRESADIEVPLDSYLSENRIFFDALKKNAAKYDGSFSPSQLLCGTGSCMVEYEGNPLYADDNHVSSSTADFWIRALQRPKPAH